MTDVSSGKNGDVVDNCRKNEEAAYIETLTINNITNRHNGTRYKCRATNKKGNYYIYYRYNNHRFKVEMNMFGN